MIFNKIADEKSKQQEKVQIQTQNNKICEREFGAEKNNMKNSKINNEEQQFTTLIWVFFLMRAFEMLVLIIFCFCLRRSFRHR